MTEKRDFDAIFVGGGVIGLSCAWHAARHGARVIVLERLAPGSGATAVAAGMLAPVGELSFGEPELAEMTLASARLYPEFVAELESETGMSTGYARPGALHVALDPDEAAQLRRVHQLQRSFDLEAEWLAARRCRELEPGLAPSICGGVEAPGEGAIDPRALTAALLAALAGRGVEVREGVEVAAGIFDGERLRGVRTGDGEELLAGAVVLASGAWAGTATWLPKRMRPPVRPVKGEVLGLRSRDGAALPAGRVLASERVYLVPREEDRLIVGATVEERGFDTTVTAGGVLELLREAYRLLPEVAEMELADAVAGLRPGTPDNLPLIGPGAIDGLLLATGHYRNGILLAPLTGQAVTALLDGRPVPDTIAAASPLRPSFEAHGLREDGRASDVAGVAG